MTSQLDRDLESKLKNCPFVTLSNSASEPIFSMFHAGVARCSENCIYPHVIVKFLQSVFCQMSL